MEQFSIQDKAIIRKALQDLANSLGEEVASLTLKMLSEGTRPVLLDIQIAKLKECIRLINKF